MKNYIYGIFRTTLNSKLTYPDLIHPCWHIFKYVGSLKYECEVIKLCIIANKLYNRKERRLIK